MKQTVSSTYTTIANSAATVIRRNVYMKQTTAVSESLSSGTWIDVSDYVTSLPDIMSSVEYDVGQFTTDSVSLELSDIQYVTDNLLNLTDGQYLECKITTTLDGASDVIVMFSGFVDVAGVTSNEISDTVSLNIYTAQDLASRMAGEYLSTKYIESDVADVGVNATSGSYLFNIPSIYVVTASGAMPLKVGTHELTYDYNSGIKRLKLDSGRWMSVSTSSTTVVLGDGDTLANDTERVSVYVRDASKVYAGSTTVSDKLVIVNSGSALPNQWYTYAGARYLLSNIYTQMGVTASQFDTLTMNTAPYPTASSEPYKVSFIDYPPNDGSVNGKKWAITSDGTDMFIAIGHKVYKRTTSSELYSLIITLSSGDRISKLMYNTRNNQLWVFYGNVSHDSNQNKYGNGTLRKYDIGTNTLSAAVTLNQTTDETYHNSISVFDYNYTGASYKYGVVYTDGDWDTGAGRLRIVDGSTLSISTIVSGSQYGYSGNSQSTIVSRMLFVNNGEVWFKGTDGIGSNDDLIKVHVNTSGNWVNDGIQLSNLDPYKIAAFNPTNSRIFYWLLENGSLNSHTTSSATLTGNYTGFGLADEVNDIYYNSVSQSIVFTRHEVDAYSPSVRDDYYFYQFKNNPTNSVTSSQATGVHVGYGTPISQVGGKTIGIDNAGRLFQYHNTLAFYVPEADFSDSTVQDAMNKTLQAFNLVGKISPTKKAFVYRRGNSSGDALTTGDTLTVTNLNASDITKVKQSSPAIRYVSITNGTDTITYDGGSWDSKVLSDVKRLSINNDLIPSEILQDIAYTTFQFFKTSRDLYTVDITTPVFQYEPFDNCNLSLSGQKISVDISGTTHPIYKVVYQLSQGAIKVEVLV